MGAKIVKKSENGKVKTKKCGVVRRAQRFIKGTMGTEGIMGIMGLFPEIPAFPAFPEIPENSPKKAKPFKLKSVVRFAWINCLETAGTAETTERIFDTLFRCRLFRLCGLCGLKKNLPKRETQFLVRRAPSATLGKNAVDG